MQFLNIVPNNLIVVVGLNSEKPCRELSVGEIFSLTLNMYLSRFWQFFCVFLVGGIVTGLLSLAVMTLFPMRAQPSSSASFEELMAYLFALLYRIIIVGVLLGLVSWIVGCVTGGFAVKYASDLIEGRSPSLSGSLNFAFLKLPSLLVAQFIAGVLFVVGLILLIVPGIIIAIMFSLTIPAIIIEQRDAFESLSRSRKLVSNRWLKAFAVLLLIAIIILVVSSAASLLASPLNAILPNVDQLVSNVTAAFATPISPIAVTYLYYAMTAKEAQQPPPPPPPNF